MSHYKTVMKCSVCGKEQEVYRYLVEKRSKKYCSRKCLAQSQIGGQGYFLGGKHTSESRAKMSKAAAGRESPFKGKKHSVKTIAKISAHRKGKVVENEHYEWKGDAVGYRTLHKWVVKHLGQPETCTHCKKSGLKGRKIGWANISHEYYRRLDDWMRLCTRCHRAYDLGKLNLSEIEG